ILDAHRMPRVYAATDPVVSYAVNLAEFRDSAPLDREIVAGERAVAEERVPEAVMHFRAAGDSEELANSLEMMPRYAPDGHEMDYLREALAIWRSRHDRQNEAGDLVLIANRCQSLGNWQDALSNARQALAIAEEIGNSSWRNRALYVIGDVYRDL